MKKSIIAFFVRHGETKLNAGGQFRSWIDVPLDDKGKQQAIKAARFLWKLPISRIICSPLNRTITTAEVLSVPKRINLEQDHGLLPWRLGMFSGLNKEDNLDALNLFVENPEVQIPNGESLSEFRVRAHEAFERILSEAKQRGLTIVVTHTSNITCLSNWISGETSKPEDKEIVQPGGIVAVYNAGGGYKLKPVLGAGDGEDE